MKTPRIARFLVPLPDAKRPSRESPCKKSAIRRPTVKVASFLEKCNDLKESRGAGTRSSASSRPARWQRGGQRNQRQKQDTARAEFSTGGFWTTAPPTAHAGRSFDVSRRKIGGVVHGAKRCKNLRSETELSNRSGDVPQVRNGAHAHLWSETSDLTVPWLRIRTIALSREFSITMVHGFLLQ